MSARLTPSQTVGPFFSIGLPYERGPFAVEEATPGAFWIRGTVRDGNGDPVPDALIETWQAGTDGRFASGAEGFARSPSDEKGRFGIFTVKPGTAAGADGHVPAPHLEVALFARGLLKQLYTRIYFDDEGVANAADPILDGIADETARATLIAETAADGYLFDIRLQGDGETVFFAF